MSKIERIEADYHTHIPVIFAPKVDAVKSRQEVAEKMMCCLLQDEKFLQMLQENLL